MERLGGCQGLRERYVEQKEEEVRGRERKGREGKESVCVNVLVSF